MVEKLILEVEIDESVFVASFLAQGEDVQEPKLLFGWGGEFERCKPASNRRYTLSNWLTSAVKLWQKQPDVYVRLRETLLEETDRVLEGEVENGNESE